MRKRKILFNRFILFLGITILWFCGTQNEAKANTSLVDESIYQYSSSSVTGGWYDEASGNFIYQTLDKVRSSSSSTYYSTFLLEFSRIKSDVTNPYDSETYTNTGLATHGDDDPHVYTQWGDGSYHRDYFTWNIELANPHVENVTINGVNYAYCTYVIDKEEMFGTLLQYYPDWMDELEQKEVAGEDAWIGLDCVICVHNGGPYGDGWSGYAYASEDNGSRGFGTTYGWSNWTDLGNIFDINGANSGIRTHYNQYVKVTTDIPIIDDPPENGEPTDTPDGDSLIIKTHEGNIEPGTGENQSGNENASTCVYTYNTSDEYELGVAIPSTESYTNGISTGSWYGTVDVSRHSVTRDIYVPYTLVESSIGTQTRYLQVRTTSEVAAGEHNGLNYPDSYDRYDENSGYYYYTCWYYTSENSVTYYTGTYTYSDAEYYYSITDLDLFQYQDQNVNNDFSSVLYNETPNISYNISINGNNVNSEEGTKFEDTEFETDTEWHVQAPETSLTITGRNVEGVNSAETALSYVEGQVNAYMAEHTMAVKNDTLELNGVTYFTENSIDYDWQSDSDYTIGAESNDRVESNQIITIPAATPNGSYFTSTVAHYKNFAAGDSTIALSLTDNETEIPAILSGYETNEPIIVHTPVISPISINGEIKTQLDNHSRTMETQLILDNTYTMSFDWDTYFSYMGYQNEENFQNYVLDKQVRFPFAVSYDGTYYEVAADGYTDWISVGNVDSFEFYLPTWAKEGVYGSAGYTEYDAYNNPIQARVYAVNYIEEERDHWQPVANLDMANYYATYNYPVQISGVFYDFQVVSINDPLTFDPDASEDDRIYSFVSDKKEIRAGNNNREGSSVVRNTLDGSLAADRDNTYTLPFTSGLTTDTDGTLYGGHTIGFTVKTIASSYQEESHVEIHPSYRFIDKNGVVYDDVSIYYHAEDELYKNIYEDDMMRTVSLNNGYFADCYYNYTYDTVDFTAGEKHTTAYRILNQDPDSFTYGKVNLNSAQSLFTGDEVELRENLTKPLSQVLRYNVAGGLGSISDNQVKNFRSSIQTWYGNYQIPTEIFVCRAYPDGTDDYTRLLGDGQACTDDSGIWMKDGFLVLNFSLTEYADDSHAHLSYYEGTLNMWNMEAGDDSNCTIRYMEGAQNGIQSITFQRRSGDIAVIDLSTNIKNRYRTGILYLN